MSWIRNKRLQMLCTVILVLTGGTTIPGCGGSGMTTVEGTVTLDGKPLPQGAISFEAANGQSATAGATIEGGKYVAEVPPGEKKVRITGFEVVGQEPAYKGMPDSPMRDIVKDLVPKQYNTETKLTLTVGDSATPGDFDLNSKTR